MPAPARETDRDARRQENKLIRWPVYGLCPRCLVRVVNMHGRPTGKKRWACITAVTAHFYRGWPIRHVSWSTKTLRVFRGQMAEKTRGLFFSVACDGGRACEGIQGDDSTTAGHMKRGKENTGTGDGSTGGSSGKRRFRATFGRKEAWAASENCGVATEGERDHEHCALRFGYDWRPTGSNRK